MPILTMLFTSLSQKDFRYIFTENDSFPLSVFTSNLVLTMSSKKMLICINLLLFEIWPQGNFD